MDELVNNEPDGCDVCENGKICAEHTVGFRALLDEMHQVDWGPLFDRNLIGVILSY